MIKLAENPVADVSGDPLWLVIVKVVAVFALLVLLTLFTIWFERRVVGRMQSRPGPDKLGPFGLVQPLADGIKLALKEDLVPAMADKAVFLIAPAISATAAFAAYAVIPLGPDIVVWGTDIVTPLQVSDLPVAVMYVLAVASVGVYGILLAGWSSGSTYPLLGGLRSSAQVISYEIAMGLALISVFMVSGSMSTSSIVAAQADAIELVVPVLNVTVPLPGWYALSLFPSFVIYVIAMVGETNRAPFDLPEAEGELVGGFHTEYSSMKFALFFLAEYVNMITVSSIATTLFLGGWHAPVPGAVTQWVIANQPGFLPASFFTVGAWGVFWFVLKVVFFLWFFIWLRGTLPRLRYDQFMTFGWKVLIPAALVWVVIVSVYRTLNSGEFARGSLMWWTLYGTLVVIVVAAFLVFTTMADRRAEKQAAMHHEVPEVLDPFAGGFPVPPLPGQRLVRTNGRTLAATGATLTAEAAWGTTADTADAGPAPAGPTGSTDTPSESEADR